MILLKRYKEGSEALITSLWSSEEFGALLLQAWSKIEFDMVHTPMSMFMGSEGVLTRKSEELLDKS